MPAAVGVFANPEDARATVIDLMQRGFPRESISLARRDEAQRVVVAEGAGGGVGGTVTGIAAGSVLGALTGLLVGLSTIAIPGIGPILAAGPLATTLVGTAIGATAGGLVGALVDLGLPEERAVVYQDRVADGNTLLTVRAADDNATEVAAEVMRAHHAADLDVA